MDPGQVLKYLLSQNYETKIQQLEQWQKQMEAAGYTSEYLNQSSDVLKVKSKIEESKRRLFFISANYWQGSLFTKTVAPNNLFLGFSECSGVNKTIFDAKNCDFGRFQFSFNCIPKYWILSGVFDELICYDKSKTKATISKLKNKISIRINDFMYIVPIINSFSFLSGNSDVIIDENCEFDILLRISQSFNEIMIDVYNFSFDDSNLNIEFRPTSIKFEGDANYFSVSSNLIFNSIDGYLNRDNLNMRKYFRYAISMNNLNMINDSLNKWESKQLAKKKNLVSSLHRLVLNAMISISSLEKDVARVKSLKMELSYQRNISIHFPNHRIFLNKYPHDLFSPSLKTQFVGWNFTYGERDRFISPIVCDVETKLKTNSSIISNAFTSYFQCNSFGNPDNMFLLNVTDKNGNTKKVICEAIYSLKYKDFKYVDLKSINKKDNFQKQVYFFGLSEIELYDEHPKLQALSMVSENEGDLYHLFYSNCSPVLSFKIISESIEYLGVVSPKFTSEFEYNGKTLKLSGNLTLSEDFDGVQMKKCLTSEEFVLIEDVKCLFTSFICEGKRSSSKTKFNDKTWPGIRSRFYDNDAYLSAIQAHCHSLKLNTPFRSYVNYSDILYSANDNFHYVEANGCFTERKNYLYWDVPISNFEMMFDESPCVKLSNQSILTFFVNYRHLYEVVEGKNHPCLLSCKHHVEDYSITQIDSPPILFLPFNRPVDIIYLEQSSGDEVLNEMKIISFEVKEFTAYVLPENLNTTMNIVGKLLNYESELELVYQTNNVISDMMNNFDKRLSDLEKFCDFLDKSYIKKAGSSTSLYHLLGDIFTFVGEICVLQFPILGFCFILTGIMVDALGKITQEDIFDGISEIAFGGLLLCLGKRKPKFTYLEELGFGRRRASSNSYISEMASSVGRRRSYSSYHHYESISDLSPSLSIRDRIMNQIRSHNPSVFDLHHNSGIILELKQKQKENYSLLNSSYSRMKRSISNVINDEVINYKLSCDNPSSCEVYELCIKTFDYYPILLDDNSFFIIKIQFKIKITSNPVKMKIEDIERSYFHTSDASRFRVFDAAKFDVTKHLNKSLLSFTFNEISNYLCVISLLSKTSSIDNMLIENHDKLYDTLYISNHKSYMSSDPIHLRQVDFTIFKTMHTYSFSDHAPDDSYFKMISSIVKHPEILRF
ncbi:P4 protein [Rice black streaked dwarf virus]|uniref:p4 protein n=1 Tax=Rice black streaked dwarf virus TaxID=10990 RepID=Q8UZ05_RBSDV|nr:P4 protein [Rice black streaked dwarf virus]CAC84074.1 P4 protein [Rice black streaked dwarf virus]